MNTYISSSNQKLLWKTISESGVFSRKSLTERENWFRQIVGQIYESNKHNNYIDIKEVNIATIEFMLRKLEKERDTERYRVNDESDSSNKNRIQINEPHTNEDLSKIRREEMEKSYSQRLQDFENTFRRDLPVEVDLSDFSKDDSPLTAQNTNEMFKQELSQRGMSPGAAAAPVAVVDNLTIKNTQHNIKIPPPPSSSSSSIVATPNDDITVIEPSSVTAPPPPPSSSPPQPQQLVEGGNIERHVSFQDVLSPQPQPQQTQTAATEVGAPPAWALEIMRELTEIKQVVNNFINTTTTTTTTTIPISVTPVEENTNTNINIQSTHNNNNGETKNIIEFIRSDDLVGDINVIE